MSDLIHIVYLSVSSERLSEKELDDLLCKIRKNNKELEITGLLLYNDEVFIQVTEGTRYTIQNLYEIIKKDSRHSYFIKLLEEPKERRTFPDWSMGYRNIRNNKDSSLSGYSNFKHTDHSTESIRLITKKAMYLSNSFREPTPIQHLTALN